MVKLAEGKGAGTVKATGDTVTIFYNCLEMYLAIPGLNGCVAQPP